MTTDDRSSRQFWDGTWSNDENRDFWTRVAPEIVELTQTQSPAQRPAVLDLGCGLGRNAIAFAQAGFQVTATDISPTGVAHLRDWAAQLGLDIHTRISAFTEDRFAPASFDIIVSVNVLYHAYREQVVQAFDHVRRWLKPGGIFYFTFPTRDDGEYGKIRERAPHTFELEPGHMHYYADENDLQEWLTGFTPLWRKTREHHWEKDGVPQFSCRWQVLVEKP